MKKTLCSIVIASMTVGLGVQAQDGNNRQERRAERELRLENRENRAQLDDLTKSVNQMARKGENMDVALKSISIETGVPMERVRDMHNRHPDAGVGGILNACVLAAETKKDPEDFFRQHRNGKNWAAIARENNVPFEKLTVRLDRVEKYLDTDAKKAKNKNK